MRTWFSILFYFLSLSVILSQSTFEYLNINPDDQIINDVTEDDDGNFILVGRKNSIELDKTQAYLIRLSPSGELLNEIVIDTAQGYSMFFNAFFFNDSLFLLGSRRIDAITAKLLYLKMDKNLEIIDEKNLGIPSDRWFSYMNSILDSDSNFVITGYTTRYDTVSPYNMDPFFYKLSLAGDSINSNFITSNHKLSMSFDIIEKSDQTGYYSYGFKYYGFLGNGGERFELSKQFDSINMLDVQYWMDLYISSEKLSDSIIIISGNGVPPGIPTYSLSVLSTTMDNDPIDYNHFKIEGDMRDHTAMAKGLSINGSNIYVGGTSNFDYSNPFFSTLDSWFHLIKINPDLTPIWEYCYGGDAYYQLYTIMATSDSGCIMVGNRYDYETQGQERDIYVVKVNSEGLIVWTKEIQPGESLFSIYPNPGNESLNINSPLDRLQIQLFDLTGRMEFEAKISSGINSIPVSSLPAGIYLYRILDKKNQTIRSGKWIKN
jgi:hypothetical protein